MARTQYLAPNGKMYTEAQLDKLNMKQIFDMLVKLEVADKSMYKDHKKMQKRTRSRANSRTRSRTSSKKRKGSKKVEYVPVYYQTTYDRSAPRAPRPPPMRRPQPMRRSIPTPPPLPPSRARPQPTRAGCANKGEHSCGYSPNCYWTGAACINR